MRTRVLPIECGNVDRRRALETRTEIWPPDCSSGDDGIDRYPSGVLLLARDPEKELSVFVPPQFMPQPWLGLQQQFTQR